MRPVALLVVFCGVMSAIAVGRVAIDDDRDLTDVGVALIVVGSLLLSVLWVSLDTAVTIPGGHLLLAVTGVGLVAAGTGLLGHSLRQSAERSG